MEQTTVDTTSERADEPLVSFLREYSLASTPRRLMWHTLAGVAQVTGTLWSMPTGWLPLTLAGACLTSYGIWSFTDAQLESGAQPTGGPRRRRVIVRSITGGLGVATAFATLLTGASLLLGRWIS